MEENKKGDEINGDKIGTQINLGDNGMYIEKQYIIQPTHQIPHHLTIPPFIPSIFLGREDEMQTVHDKLFGGENFLMLVNGQGGIGKTSFAAKYWERYEKEYTHLAFLFVGNGIMDALLTLADALQLSFPPDMLNEAKLQQLIYRISNLDKPCLLILDNANEEKELNDHILLLRQCPNCHILLTSRLDSYPSAQKHAIGALPLPLALQLFRKHYELLSDAEIPLFEEVYKAVEGNTLVLELLAKNLNNFNTKLKKRYTLAQLLDDLQSNLLRLSQSKEVQTAYQAKGTGWRNETPEAIISGMYELSELEEAERKLLSIFAVLPAEHIEFDVLENLLQSSDFDNLDQILLSLVQKGWVEEKEKGYKVSPVVQAVTHYKQSDLLADCLSFMQYLIDGMSRDSLDHGKYEQAAHCAYFAQSMIYALQGHKDDYLATLCQNLGNYYTMIGNLGSALQVYEQMQIIQQHLVNQTPTNADYKNGLAISYEKLGETQSSLGNLEAALRYFEIETKLFEELYEAYPTNVGFKNGLAISYSKLGETQSPLGNLEAALRYFEEFKRLMKELYEAYPTNVGFKNGLAISYSKLGETQSSLGNLEAALRFFEEYNRLEKELYEAYPTNVGFKNSLAISYYKLGVFSRDSFKDKKKAKAYFLQAEALWKELVRDAPQYVDFQRFLAQVQEILEGL